MVSSQSLSKQTRNAKTSRQVDKKTMNFERQKQWGRKSKALTKHPDHAIQNAKCWKRGVRVYQRVQVYSPPNAPDPSQPTDRPAELKTEG